MSWTRYIGAMAGAAGRWMRESRDLAMIAAVRTRGLLAREIDAEGRSSWSTVSVDVSSDGDDCMVVSPCLVVTAPAGATHATTSIIGSSLPEQTQYYYEARPGDGSFLAGGIRGAHPGGPDEGFGLGLEFYGAVAVAMRSAGPVRLEGPSVVAEPSSFFGLSIEGLALWTVSANTLLRADAGNVTVNAGGAGGTIALQHDGTTRIAAGPDETLVRGGESVLIETVMASGNSSVLVEAGAVAVKAASGSYVLAGHDGDTVGERVLVGRGGVKTTAQNSTASYANDTGVVVALRANRRYQFRHFFMFSGGTGNIEVAYTWPSGATVRWHQAANSATAYITAADTGLPWGVQSPGREVEHRGYIQTAGTAGNLQSRFRHATDTKSMGAGSHLILYDLGPV